MTTEPTHSSDHALEPAAPAAPLNVFLTGGETALGRALTRLLAAEGHTVVCAVPTSRDAGVVREAGGLPAYPNLERAGEIRSLMTGFKTDVAINLALQAANGVPCLPHVWDTELAAKAAALIQAAHEAGVAFVVHTSYAFADVRDEAAAPLLRAARRAEKAVLNGAVPACVLRFGFLYGPDDPDLHELRSALRLGRPVPLGSDHAHAAWTYTPDAARALMLAVQRRPAGRTLTVIDDRLAPPAAFVRYLAESASLGVPGGLPPFVGNLLSNRQQLAVMNLDVHADNRAAREALGWAPRFAGYQAAIDDMLLHWRATEPVA